MSAVFQDMSSLMHTIYDVVDASVNHSCHSKSKTLRVKLTVTPEPSTCRRDATHPGAGKVPRMERTNKAIPRTGYIQHGATLDVHAQPLHGPSLSLSSFVSLSLFRAGIWSLSPGGWAIVRPTAFFSHQVGSQWLLEARFNIKKSCYS